MTTFLVRTEPPPGDGPTLAVKDIIDVAGLPTTCGSRAVASHAEPATHDAVCVARARAAGARIVGKTNLHELAFGGTGINPFTGTPVNPLDASRIPGGSSSGSAVAVATGAADIALGTDTGGSIRTPAACCGVVGLKTTNGRIPLGGVHPLAPTLDTVGPMAANVDGVARGMALLDTGFVPAAEPDSTLGRFLLPGVHPDLEAAIDALLAEVDLEVRPVDLPGWDAADRAGSTVAFAEAHRVHRHLLATAADQLGDEVRDRLEAGARIPPADYSSALATAGPWRDELDRVLDRTSVVVMAAIVDEPPRLADAAGLDTRRPNVAVNLAGHPALVLPVARPGRLPTALQLIAARGREDLLCATARILERPFVHMTRTETMGT